ncbi:unnamed protein product [Prorocentrum cordatum]|uniref:Uncharacterized protein n=1 Tax=Prorocentrum cordatum TaxID=2364126 RepID=A0ABN9TNK3_9DINO|nr:unnamed protein product [Polarella glacialis]
MAPPSQKLSAGVSARLQGGGVFVLAVYTTWRVPRADVAPLRRGGDGWVARLRDARTVDARSSTEVHTCFTPRPDEIGRGASVHFQRRAPLEVEGATSSMTFAPARGLANRWAARVAVPRDPAETTQLRGRAAEIQPQASRGHAAASAALGNPRGAFPRHDRVVQVRYILDAPLPMPFDARPWRGTGPCGRVFPVGDADIRSAFPGTLARKPPKEAPMYMAAAFLVLVIQSFYDELNVRAVRRRTLSLHAANALSLQLGSGAAAAATAVPPQGALRSMLKVALGNFLDTAVARVQRLQCLCNGSADVDSCPTCITGDPWHDVIALRKLVPPTCNDWRDFIADHADALNRLSAPLPPAPTLGALPSPPSLAARRLLRFGVEQPATAFGRGISRRPRAARELRQLLGSAGALRPTVWQEEFQAIPPRGALERLAKRLGGPLHPDSGLHNFLDHSGFKKEIRRLRKRHKGGGRLTRARRGMIRSDTAPAQVRGARSVFNTKVRTHYRRLLQSARLEGLFAWRDAAVAIRAAGVAVQSGAVSVERVWGSLLDMFPDQARNVSPEWFALCSKVAFLRFNYRHFHAGRSPPWCDGDPLMAERLDRLAAQLRPMADEGPDDGAGGAMAALYRPFS